MPSGGWGTVTFDAPPRKTPSPREARSRRRAGRGRRRRDRPPIAANELENLLADEQVPWGPHRAPRSQPRLTVELVPETCWYSKVRSELSTTEWDLIRRHAYQAAGYRCETCAGHGPREPVHCHEVWHYNDHTLVQRLERMIALCPNCHEVKHIGHANTIGRGHHARTWLAKINHWTPDQVEAYLAQQGELWLKRSRHQWRLDITALARHGVTPPAPTPPIDAELVRFEASAEPPAIGHLQRSWTP
jgi:hypothetical protein